MAASERRAGNSNRRDRGRVGPNMLPSWTTAFLASLSRTGVVTESARAVGVTRSTVHSLRQRYPEFSQAWDDAIEQHHDALEAELIRRATDGVQEPVVYQGQLTPVWQRDEAGEVVRDENDRPVQARDASGQLQWLTVSKKSDALLMFALKGRRAQYRTERTELTGADGAPVQIDENTRAARVAALFAAAQQRRDQAPAADADEPCDLA